MRRAALDAAAALAAAGRRGFASRRPKLNVVLQESVSGLGNAGDTVAVRPGYARNFLVPSGAAAGVRPARADRSARVPRSQQRVADPTPSTSTSAAAPPTDEATLAAKRLASVARRLAGAAVEIPARGDKSGTLRAPVSAADIVAAVEDALRVRMDARLLAMDGPIRVHGEHAVPLKLLLGGERVSLTVRVGEPAKEDDGAGEAAASSPAKKAGKKKK